MPTFSSAQVTDPFPNILFNPMAVDKAIADNQSTLGNLDINRQTLALAQQKLDATRAGNAVWTNPDTTDTTGATVGPLADAAPDQTRDAAGQASYNFWVGKGLAPHMAAGMAAQEVAESGGRPGAVGDGGDAIGAYQHHADRRALILANTGIDMTKADINAQREGAYWELMNREHGARQLLFASKDADEAGRAATEFERPDSKRRAIIDAERGRDARRIFQLANPNGAAGVATATVDPRAGPRAVLAPPPPVATAAPTTAPADLPTGDPGRKVQIPPTTTTGQADDPNMAAVKQAATALLAMPEAEAAVAYGPTVRSLQAQGFAMNAPPTYPGHAALQSLVGGGDATATAVDPSRVAMRLGGTDAAGPGAGTATLPPGVQPNRLAYGTDLPGVTIGLPGNGLAPPATTAAPMTTAAAPTAPPAPVQARPQVLQPPAAPSRAIDLTPTIQGGQYDGLTRNQAKEIYSMGLSLVPTQEITARVEMMRQQNTALKQTAITNLAAQQQADFARQQWLYEQQVKAGWEDVGGGVIRNKYTGETKYGGPPAPRSTKDEQGNTWLLEPGQPPKLMSANPSGVTGSGPDASALRTLNELAAKRSQGIQLTPQEEVNYATAADVYQGMETIKNDVTKETVQVPKRPLPPGIPEPPGRGGAGAAGGPKVVLPGLSPSQQEIERDPAAYTVAETNYKNDAQDIRSIAEAGRQAQADQVRIKEMQDVLQRFSTGSGTEARTAAANWFQRWAPAAITGWEKQSPNLSGSDAAQAFSKLALVGAGTQERGVLGARGGYQAIKLFKEANPNVDLQDATNKSILDMQLITNQANQDYTQGAQSHFVDNETKFQTTHKYDSLNRFDRDWNAKRNPEVYSAAMGAISGQPYEQWSKGLQEPEIERALGVVSRANPSAVVNSRSGPISMQPRAGQGTGTGSSGRPPLSSFAR